MHKNKEKTELWIAVEKKRKTDMSLESE